MPAICRNPVEHASYWLLNLNPVVRQFLLNQASAEANDVLIGYHMVMKFWL